MKVQLLFIYTIRYKSTIKADAEFKGEKTDIASFFKKHEKRC